jgi:hypothetical protein
VGASIRPWAASFWRAVFDVQAIVQQVGGDWADIPAWVAALAVLAVFAVVVALVAGRRAARAGKIAEPPARIERGAEWELVVQRARQDLWRGPGLVDLQADARLRIESAEHAYNRMVADCARLCDLPVAPTFEPATAPPDAPEASPAPPERPPLAA